MKIYKKIVVNILFLMLLLMLIGCSNSNVKKTDETKKEETLQENTQQSTVNQENVKQGKYMIIKLKTNPSTGFDYVYDTTADSIGDIDLEDEFNDNTSSSDPKIVGASFIRTYIFSAEKCTLGNVTLDFNYKRNWEGGENAYHVFYDVEIKEGDIIEFKGKRVKKEEIDVNIEDFEDPTFVNEYIYVDHDEEIEEETYEDEPED